MLETLDLNRKMRGAEWRALREPLARRLAALQEAARQAELPVIVLFEGWDAAGAGAGIQALAEALDPRYFRVWPMRAPRTFEVSRPWLWRFWMHLPARGEIAIFDRSWYGRVLGERVEHVIGEEQWQTAYRDILDLERTLADDGHLIVKYWYHISRDGLRGRLKQVHKSEAHQEVAPSLSHQQYRKYDEYREAAEELLARTGVAWAPWTIIEAPDARYAAWKVLSTCADALGRALDARGLSLPLTPIPSASRPSAVLPIPPAPEASLPAAGDAAGELDQAAEAQEV